MLEKYMNKKTWEVFKYLFFGVLTTIVNWVVYFLIRTYYSSIGIDINVTPSPYVSIMTVISFIVAVIFAFITNKLFVFDSKTWEPKVALRELASFISARIFTFFVELVGMFVMTTYMSMNDLIAKAVISVAVIILNYIFSKLFIFKSVE